MSWLKNSITQEDIDKLIALVGFVCEDQVAGTSDDEEEDQMNIDENFYRKENLFIYLFKMFICQ